MTHVIVMALLSVVDPVAAWPAPRVSAAPVATIIPRASRRSICSSEGVVNGMMPEYAGCLTMTIRLSSKYECRQAEGARSTQPRASADWSPGPLHEPLRHVHLLL